MNLPRNLTLLMDFYELTMSNGYLKNQFKDTICIFDVYYRKNPDNGGFCIFAGLEQLVYNIQNLKFTDDDIKYLKNKNLFTENFLDYLKNFKFSCDIWSIKEGTPIFPNEPIMTIKGPIIEAQLIETITLLSINHQTLVATKANRLVRSANGKKVFEFGTRRAQGYDSAILGSRAAYIGGCHGTSCTISGRDFNVPTFGTMAHSWVQMFDSEYEAFHAYASTYPDNCTLLVDTYNTLKSGIPNAIKVFNDVLKPLNKRPQCIRIDSGDLAYISKQARQMLDKAGFSDVEITVSNSLDEYLIRDIMLQGAFVDGFGVGENLITSSANPVLGVVYKLVAIEKGGNIIPKIKVSETLEKISTPSFKKLYRIKNKETNMSLADYLCNYDEFVHDLTEIEIFDPNATWRKKKLTNIYLENLHHQIFSNGKLVYKLPDIEEIRNYCSNEVATIWDEVKRFEHPHKYYVDLSNKVFNIKKELLENFE
ncbi:MAG: nicotinate phosphoribosyltransferase [Oscillospiraceae bacterium]